MRKPSKSILKVLAKNVRQLRHEQSISQEELAELCGLHRTYIGAVERGERNVTLSTLEVLAAAFHLSVPELIAPRKEQ